MILFMPDWPYVCELCHELHTTPIMVDEIGGEPMNRMIICGTCRGLMVSYVDAKREGLHEKAEELLDRLEARRAQGLED